MSAGVQYKLGLDANELAGGFSKALRFAGDFVNGIQTMFSLRGLAAKVGSEFLSGLRAGLDKEEIQQSFEGHTGEAADQVASFLAELETLGWDANKQFAELTQTARLLADAGMNTGRMTQDMRRLAEVSRATGKDLAPLAEAYRKFFTNDPEAVSLAMRSLKSEARGLFNEVKRLAGDADPTFRVVEQALHNVTSGTGLYAGQIERWSNSLKGSINGIADAWDKVKVKFSDAVFATALGAAKERVGDIERTIVGWSNTARESGAMLGALLSTANDLFKAGKFVDTIKVGLGGLFDSLIEKLKTGLRDALVPIARGLVVALVEAFLAIQLKERLSKSIEGIPVAGKALAGLALGLVAINPGDIVGKAFDKAMPNGAGDNPNATKFWETFMPLYLKNLAAGLPPLNGSDSVPRGASAPNYPADDAKMTKKAKIDIDSDALAKIGLYTSAGGPQGEAHAKSTAANTKATATNTEKTFRILEGWPKSTGARF